MPKTLSWTPKTKWARYAIEQELQRIRDLGGEAPAFAEPPIFAEEPPKWQLPPTTTPIMPALIEAPPQWEAPPAQIEPTEAWQPRPEAQAMPTRMPTPREAVTKPTEKVEAGAIKVPFWQRALQVFTTPFQWVEETLIKPGLAQAATSMGAIPEVKREFGEDYWDWKKRSWEAWKPAGLDINVPWRDKPMRLDIRGILELAPWLLIPGAGQVGAGLRAARGIAGILGKLGPAGKALGYAVEYSPWGMVEKTAGAALRVGIKAGLKGSEKLSTAIGEKVFGKYVPPPVPESIQILNKYMRETAMPAYRKFRKEISATLRTRQEAATRAVREAYLRGEIPFEQLQSKYSEALKKVGALKPEFTLTPEALAVRQAKDIANIEARVASGEISESVGKTLITKAKQSKVYTPIPFTPAAAKEMTDMLIRANEYGLLTKDSSSAFIEFTLKGILPQRHHLREWAKVFGDDFVNAVGGLKGMSPDKVSQFIDALNIGRSLQASMDLSGTARQGLILSLLHPTRVPVWFTRQVKSLFSEKWALEIDDAMRAQPDFQNIMSATNAYMAPLKGATFTTAEELFASRAARVIPGIRRSERAFATYLNQARWTALRDGYYGMVAQKATPEQLKLFGRFVDIVSGRGEIPKSLEKFAPVLNALLFSPRLQAATLQLPRQIGRMFLSKNPYMRKEAAKTLVAFVGGGASLLALINATGHKVEFDPRSGDFGKIKIGETRLDIWRGYLQYARFAAQLLTGERKSAYGNMNKAQRGEIAWRLLQSKGSPAFGLMVDLFRGETYMGDPIFNDTTGFSKVARERILPLAIQDIIDAMEMNGINGLWTAAPATLGIGVLTYVDDLVRVRQKITREIGYDSWDDIDPITRKKIENSNAELQAAEIGFDRQIMGTAWGDWRLAGKAIEGNFRTNVDEAVAQYRETRDGVQFREKVSDAWTARRGGYTAREQMPQFEDIVKRMQIPDTAEALVSLGPEQLAIRAYNEALYGDDMYDEFGDYKFDEAEMRKRQLRQQLGNEMYKYVEDYLAIRYEDFPVEFHELNKARQVLKPYWQVADWAERTYGKPTTTFQQRRINQIVSRIRKRLRAINPQIEHYFNLFYTNR